MSSRQAHRRSRKRAECQDRRVPASAQGLNVSLRRLKGALSRPLALERRNGSLHIVLVERRRSEAADRVPSVRQIRQELRARLLGHAHEHAALTMRHLGHVHDVLGRQGWPGVEELHTRVLGRALVQAQMLASDDASPALTEVIDRLRRYKVAAELRDERHPRGSATACRAPLEVSESDVKAFAEAERDWSDTRPSLLDAVEGRD